MSGVLVGGGIVVAASLLGGLTGFGYGLVATPLLLVAGFSLPFVVTANLAVSLVTRVSVVCRHHRLVDRRRTALLVAGSVPGLYLGARLLTLASQRVLEVAVGALVMALAATLALERREEVTGGGTVGPLGAGLAGGVLGTLGSLNGVVPALFLARERVAPRVVVADLAAYFVASNAIGLAMLAARGRLATSALLPDALVWLPGALAANVAGIALGPRLPRRLFRSLVMALAFAAGAVTIATAH